MLNDLKTHLSYLWHAPADPKIDPAVLNFYRGMLILGQVSLLVIVISLENVAEIVSFAPWICYTYISISLIFNISTLFSEWTREHLGELACYSSIILSVYVAIALYASNVGTFELLLAISIISFGAALYHKIRLIMMYCIITAAIFILGAVMAPQPQIDTRAIALVILSFGFAAGFLRSVLILAKMRRQQWDAINHVWFEESADGLLFGRTLTAKVLKSNHRMFELLECDDDSQCVYLLQKAFQATSPDRAMRDLLHEVVSNSDWQEDILFTTALGNTFWGRLTMNRVLVDERTDLLLVKISDVTQRIIYEKELEKAKDLAEAAVEVRTRFLANMSHEIRTPMNGVIGMTSLLRETDLTSQQESFLETIRTSGESLLTIINEILDFSKLDASQVQLEQQAFDLEICTSEAMDIIFPTAASKGIELLLDYQVKSSRLWIGDATRIRQVMVNLLSNAVKFTEQGQVTVTIQGDSENAASSEQSPDETNARLQFKIEDTGIGITPLQLETLFDPFIQADISTTRKYGGTGLGLSICKGLIELMGGQITATSTLGKGSTFSFDLHLKTSQNKVRELKPCFPDKHAVIIHELPASAENLAGYLRKHEISVAHYESFKTWTESLNHSDGHIEQPVYPDILFTNQRIELDDARHMNFPLVNIAAKQSDGVNDNATTSILRLPIRPTELAQLLSHLFNKNPVKISEPAKKKVWDDLPIEGKSFLLAEDNIVNQQVAIQFLAKLGIRVDVVSNGKEAVEMVHQRHYDYIFMDLQMPEIDGLEATQLIRQMELSAQPYIIAMTANAMSEDKQVCLDNGMDDFIPKPVRLKDMHSTLKQALQLKVHQRGNQLH